MSRGRTGPGTTCTPCRSAKGRCAAPGAVEHDLGRLSATTTVVLLDAPIDQLVDELETRKGVGGDRGARREVDRLVRAATGLRRRLGSRSGKHALERRAIRRLAVRGQHELDRQVEQRTEPLDDVVARHVLAPPSWTSSPSPKSESESPVTIASIDGSQRMRSLSSRPAYAVMPNGHAPGPWK